MSWETLTQAGKCTWETLTTEMFSEVTKQSQMSCIRLQRANTASLVVFTRESLFY